MNATTYFPQIAQVEEAARALEGITVETPLEMNVRLCQSYLSEIHLKREDLQNVRSYKIRGAYNKIASLSDEEKADGVVCASAGNHAQGFAYACRLLGIQGTVFMPSTTPKQKIEQVQMFGEDFVEVRLEGDLFDDAFRFGSEYSRANGCTFIHPFNDPIVIEGQGTVGLEILRQLDKPIDYVFLPIGGGGLAAGVSSVFHHLSPHTKIVGVEPLGAPAMARSLEQGEVVELEQIDKFVDGASVRRVGDYNFAVCRRTLHDVVLVDEGKVCQTILRLYNKHAVVVEPAGALSLAALDHYQDKLKDKVVVCILSGSNNDISRMEEIKERALLYEGLKHYFVVNFPQRAGALKKFVVDILGPDDDITYFQYTKKTARETGAAVVGIELKSPDDFAPLLKRMKDNHFYGGYLNENLGLMQLLT